MTDRIAEQGAVQYGQNNPTSAGVSRLGAAGRIQAAIADAITNGYASLTASRLGGNGRFYAIAANAGPLFLFQNSEVGVWYDPSDFSTMFQDSAGTTPVTAVEQPVGLLLDKSKGLVLGSELVTNGTFTDATGWTLGAGWAVSGGVLVASAGASSNADLPLAFSAGKTYLVEFDAVVTAGSCNVFYANGTSVTLPSVTTSGRYSARVAALAGNSVLRLTKLSTFAGNIDNISVRELPGNHATQATSTARPVTITNGIDCDGVDDAIIEQQGGGGTTGFFLCTAVRPDGGAGTSRTIWSDAGTNTGYIVRINASNQLELAAGNGTAYTLAVTTDTLTVGTTYVVTAWDDGTNLNVQVNSGTAGTAARPVVSAGTATATIGKDNGAASGFFNGAPMVGAEVYVKNGENVDAADRAAAKTYVAGKAGVTL